MNSFSSVWALWAVNESRTTGSICWLNITITIAGQQRQHYSTWTQSVQRICLVFHYISLHIQCESKKSPPVACGFLTFFNKQLKILNQFFTHPLYVPIYARLQIFIQLSPTLTKLCLLSTTTCAKCPPSAETQPKRTRSDVCESRW